VSRTAALLPIELGLLDVTEQQTGGKREQRGEGRRQVERKLHIVLVVVGPAPLLCASGRLVLLKTSEVSPAICLRATGATPSAAKA
jgi:hypothetical protein